MRTESPLHVPPRKQPKMIDLPVYSKSAHLVLKLEERNVIRNFFAGPVPFLAGADGVMMEIALRRLVGAECGNVADFAGSPRILEFQRKYYSQYRGASNQPFEILTVLDEEELKEMNRLMSLGIGSVPYPWGQLSSAMESEWESYPEIEELYEKKDFLTSGIHSKPKMPTIGNYSDIDFTFPLPITTDDFDPFQERPFYPPYDLTLYFDAIGGQDWVEQRSDVVPSRFQYIKKNIYVERKPKTLDEPIICKCPIPSSGPACGKNCLNRCMFFECSDQCLAGPLCSNKPFTNARELKLHVQKMPGRGFGLITKENIPSGSLVIEYRGEIISNEECKRRMETIYKAKNNHYFLHYGASEVIDGHTKGTISRYINHSCEPNCHIEKWAVDGEYKVGIFSSRYIEKGEELSYDYNFESFGPPQTCRCGAVKCRGYIGSSKLEGDVTKSAKNAAVMKTVNKTAKKHIVVPYIASKHNVFLSRNLKPSNSKRSALSDICAELARVPELARKDRLFLTRNLQYGTKPKELDIF